MDCFTYLGIQIVPQLKYIVASNYELLLQEISKLLEMWTSIPMSLIGKINVLKMNIMPKLLYLFQNLPLPPQLTCSLSLKDYSLDSFGIIDVPGHDYHYFIYLMIEGDSNVLALSGTTGWLN